MSTETLTLRKGGRRFETPPQPLLTANLQLNQWLREPVFVFTCDLDWAPEWAVRILVERFDRAGVPFTPFVTHESEVVRNRFDSADLRRQVGVHPNFLPGSTHGHTPAAVVEHVTALWPEAQCFRSHAFVDSTPITDLFAERGFRVDSNLCLFLQPGCVPLRHNSGLLRIPVFWEDDLHYKRGHEFDFSRFQPHFETPGLKVINIHPLLYALNVPDEGYYRRFRDAVPSGDDPDIAGGYAFEGAGVRTFVDAMLEFVRRRGIRVEPLLRVYEKTVGEAVDDSAGTHRSARSEAVVQEGSSETFCAYRRADREERARMVRAIYDQRNVNDIYATSRDTNLREVEIAFIRSVIDGGRVLDVGCGNGYTLLSLARTLAAEFVGLDFSSRMIEGAHALTERFQSELLSVPAFAVADVRSIPYGEAVFDWVISERCLQNLPDRESQYATLDEIARVLKPGGCFVMVEGTEDGLDRLNEVRSRLGLDPIPSAAPDNISALKFREEELERELGRRFEVVRKQYFGTYYLISRVVHPLLVWPEAPRFDAPINEIARRVAAVIPDVERLGHVMGWVVRRRA